jgi:hypothetical protein
MADAALARNLRALVLKPAPASLTNPHDKDYVVGQAAIGYRSFLDAYDVTIAASSETAGFAGVNVKSRLTHQGWKPSATGAQYLTFTAADNGQNVDYLGIAAHNLASKGASLDFQWSDDGTSWTTLLNNGHVPVSDAPFLLTFTSVAKRRFRLQVNVDGGNFPTIAVVMFGELLPLQRGIYVGHRPAPFSRDVVYNTSESEGGQIIGRSVVRRMNETEITLRRLRPAWLRANLVPFQRAAEEQPFFFVWKKDDATYVREVIYGVLGNQPRPVNEHQSFMAVDYSIRGLA